MLYNIDGDIQVVGVDNPTLEDVQYKNYTLDLDVMTYFNCVTEKSLLLYQLSEESGEDFRAQSPAIYNKFMEDCLHEQLLLIPEGQQQAELLSQWILADFFLLHIFII